MHKAELRLVMQVSYCVDNRCELPLHICIDMLCFHDTKSIQDRIVDFQRHPFVVLPALSI